MKNCTSFELLISASIDEELSIDEQTQLDWHLQACTRCRQQFDTFQLLEVQLRTVDASPAVQFAHSQLAAAKAEPKNNSPFSRPKSRTARNFFMLSGAAAALAAIVVPQWNVEDPKVTETADRISQPISELVRLNEQSEQEQRDLAKSMEYELRAIRLELSTLNADDLQDAAFNERIDSMLNQVKQWSTPAVTETQKPVSE